MSDETIVCEYCEETVNKERWNDRPTKNHYDQCLVYKKVEGEREKYRKKIKDITRRVENMFFLLSTQMPVQSLYNLSVLAAANETPKWGQTFESWNGDGYQPQFLEDLTTNFIKLDYDKAVKIVDAARPKQQSPSVTHNYRSGDGGSGFGTGVVVGALLF